MHDEQANPQNAVVREHGVGAGWGVLGRRGAGISKGSFKEKNRNVLVKSHTAKQNGRSSNRFQFSCLKLSKDKKKIHFLPNHGSTLHFYFKDLVNSKFYSVFTLSKTHIQSYNTYILEIKFYFLIRLNTK